MGDYDQDSSIDDELEFTRTAPSEVASHPVQPKAKRRTKNDNCDRSYKCGCGKDYLSYPALYTHIKQKHGGAQPNGTDSPTIRGLRGRGRPRKQNFPVLSTLRPASDDSFLKQENLCGGPIDPLMEYPLHRYPGSAEEKAEDKVYAAVELTKTDGGREEQPTCDEVFGMYLVDLAGKVTKEGYHLFVTFVQALRNCLNLSGTKLCPDFNPEESDFCESQPAQNLPEVSNYFITEYIEEHEVGLDRGKAIGMMLHLNAFLFARKFSNLKLSLIASE